MNPYGQDSIDEGQAIKDTADIKAMFASPGWKVVEDRLKEMVGESFEQIYLGTEIESNRLKIKAIRELVDWLHSFVSQVDEMVKSNQSPTENDKA